MKTKKDEWQSIPLDFFKEIISDYFENRNDMFKDKVIEIQTDETNDDRIFMDNITPEKIGKANFLKQFQGFIKKSGREDLADILDLEKMSQDLIGTVIMVSKNRDNLFIELGKDLLREVEESGVVDENTLNQLREKIRKLSDRVVTYPLMNSYLKEFLWEGLIISVPPGSTNIAGNRLNPVWFIKENGNEISGKDLKAEDWKRSLSDRYVKIRSFDYSEYQELIDKKGS